MQSLVIIQFVLIKLINMKQYKKITTTIILLGILLLYFKVNGQEMSLAEKRIKSDNIIRVTTDLYMDEKVVNIDSICIKHEEILKKMPLPIFTKTSCLITSSSGKIDSIPYNKNNKIINEDKKTGIIQQDTSEDIIREIFYNESINYGKVIYLNCATKKTMIVAYTDLTFFNIIYFSKNEVVKIIEHPRANSSMIFDNVNGKTTCYYEKNNLLLALLFSNCKTTNINIYKEVYQLYFDECSDIVFQKKISKKQLKQLK